MLVAVIRASKDWANAGDMEMAKKALCAGVDGGSGGGYGGGDRTSETGGDGVDRTTETTNDE